MTHTNTINRIETHRGGFEMKLRERYEYTIRWQGLFPVNGGGKDNRK
jgi:hypothetical protein